MATKNDAAAESAEREFVITRVFDAPRELVWKAFTESERVERWWGPKGFTTRVFKLNLRPGGVMHFRMRSPEGRDFWSKGVYREIIEPERIVLIASFSDENGSTVQPARHGMSPDWPAEALVTVTFAEHEGKTRLALHLGVSESLAKRQGADVGWAETLDRLSGYLATA